MISSTHILIFINGSNPTEEDLALGEKLGTKRFRNTIAHTEGNVEEHFWAAAVNPDWIPQGYRRSPDEELPTPEEKPDEAPEDQEGKIPPDPDAPWLLTKGAPKKPLVSGGDE